MWINAESVDFFDQFHRLGEIDGNIILIVSGVSGEHKIKMFSNAASVRIIPNNIGNMSKMAHWECVSAGESCVAHCAYWKTNYTTLLHRKAKSIGRRISFTHAYQMNNKPHLVYVLVVVCRCDLHTCTYTSPAMDWSVCPYSSFQWHIVRIQTA